MMDFYEETPENIDWDYQGKRREQVEDSQVAAAVAFGLIMGMSILIAFIAIIKNLFFTQIQ